MAKDEFRIDLTKQTDRAQETGMAIEKGKERVRGNKTKTKNSQNRMLLWIRTDAYRRRAPTPGGGGGQSKKEKKNSEKGGVRKALGKPLTYVPLSFELLVVSLSSLPVAFVSL